jgi:hypothetical protein
MATYLESVSTEVSVVVTEEAIATQLTAMVDNANVFVGGGFAVSGVLSASDVGIVDATVLLQSNMDGAWSDVEGMRAVTDVSGAYSISMSEDAAGTYLFRTRYAGGSV